jgi:predicted phage baseplate assembly protein
VHGRIPPVGGDSIQAFAYRTGGGVAGNVQAGEVTAAVTAVNGVDSVINPVAAGGGSEAATNEEMLEIGPAQISHRDRAVTPEDFERLAREASREVRKALCLPNRNARGGHELGWTSVYIVPASKDATPIPSLQLRRSVQGFLARRADATLVHQDHIFVGPPRYVPVSVEVTVFAKSIDVVASAEQSVRQKLEQFLHPLTGGPANEGWDFGRDLAASDLYALLEDIQDVDHIATLRMVFGDNASEEKVEVDADALVASGTHKISMNVATENR